MAEIISTLPDLTELAFDEGPHVYRLEGQKIPSVSNIMEPLKDALYGGISDKVLKRAASKGSAVHYSIENWLKYDFEDVPSEHRGYLDAFMDWWRMKHPKVIGSEVRMYHKTRRYAGTADLICEIGGELCLYDYKTTYTVSEMTCGVQLEAYSRALETHGVSLERKRILHLKKDGKWKEHDFPIGDTVRWKVFEALDDLRNHEPDQEKRKRIWNDVIALCDDIPDRLARLKLFGALTGAVEYARSGK